MINFEKQIISVTEIFEEPQKQKTEIHENTEEKIKNSEVEEDAILNNKIIGISNGLGEVGPRALGNRSIIALPNSIELSKKVSIKLKKREVFTKTLESAFAINR